MKPQYIGDKLWDRALMHESMPIEVRMIRDSGYGSPWYQALIDDVWETISEGRYVELMQARLNRPRIGNSTTGGVAMEQQWRALQDRWLNRPRHVHVSDHANPHISHTHVSLFDNTEKKESTMNRTEVVAREIARLQEELAVREQYGTDDYIEGTVLKFKADFNRTDGHVYLYAAIKAGGMWHLTGSRSNSNLSWEQLVDVFISTHTTKIWGMRKTQRIV